MLKTFLDIVIAGILSGGLYALIAAGFNLQYGVARILNVAHGEFIMLAALGTFTLFTVVGINPIISLIICGPVIFIIAVLIHFTIFPRLVRLSETIESFEGKSLLACFGLMYIIQNIAAIAWGTSQRGYSFMSFGVSIFGAIFEANRLIALLFSVILAIVLYLFLARSRAGKAIRAVTQNTTASQLVGIRTNIMRGLCFGLGAVLAGMAGVLISTTITITPYIGLQYTVIALIVVVLGGLGNVLGSMVGGLILGLIGSIVAYINPGITLIAYYAIFVILILVRPEGVFSRR
jgi:branched-chain amino acid transport system permease protein